MGIAAELVVGGVTAVGGGILASVAHSLLSRRCTVVRITNPDDKRLDDILDLLENTIPENEREPPEQIRRYLASARRRGLDYDEVLLLGKRGCTPLGYLYATFYRTSQLAFVNYLGIDDEILLARRFCRETLTRGFARCLRKLGAKAAGIVFEIDDPFANAGETNSKRLRRWRHFTSILKAHGYSVFKIPVRYIQPKLSVDEGNYAEEPLLLVYADPDSTLNTLSRERAIDVLRVVYEQWHGDIYDGVPEHEAEYRAYCADLLMKLAAEMPESIPRSR
jgi:hypothetical protein